MELTVKVLKRPEVSELAGEKVMIDFESGKYYMLKGVANDIWDVIEDGITTREITDKLLVAYDVDVKTCLDSVTEFLKVLADKGFISFA